MLENVSSVTLWHKEGHVVDGTIRNVVYTFIWFSFATVYGRLPHPPLPTMAIATLAIATVSLGATISLWYAFNVIKNFNLQPTVTND